METRAFKPHLIVIGLMALTSLALAFTVDVALTDQAGVKVYLPDRVGEWAGDELRFCQAPACQSTVFASQVGEDGLCPKCGGKLATMTKVELDLLPSDTEVLKKQYTSPKGDIIFASIVMSGRERSSIHRPQVCLVGQGNEIVKSAVIDIPMADRDPLGVMVLDMLRRWRSPDGRQGESESYYAYWFVGKNRETPSHVMRMIWMATDRVLFNRAHRWAYISVSGSRDKDGAYRDEINEFVRLLYPEMALQ
jgi:hypothetical protein